VDAEREGDGGVRRQGDGDRGGVGALDDAVAVGERQL
jgi:hypothetical protein